MKGGTVDRNQPSQGTDKITPWLLWAAIILCVLGSCFSSLGPFGTGVPTRDSSTFIFAGEQWAKSGGLYSVAWDHKGPLIFALPALCSLFGSFSWQALWAVETAALTGSAALLFFMIKRRTSSVYALMVPAIYAASIFRPLQQGNYTEGYCLLFIAIALYLVLSWPESLACAFGAGLSCAMILGFRINNVLGLLLFLPLAILISRDRPWARLASGTAGLAVGFTLILGLFWAAMGPQEFQEMIYANLDFNTSYSSVSWAERGNAFFKVWLNQNSPLLIIAPLLAAGMLIKTKGSSLLLAALLLSTAVQTLGLGISGRSYMHYSLILLPLSALLLALIFEGQEIRKRSQLNWMIGYGVLGVLLPLALGVGAAAKLGDSEERVVKTVEELRSVPGRSLFVWGHQANILLLDGRHFGSRFFTCAGLTNSHARREDWIEELSQTMAKSSPDILVFGDSLQGLKEVHPSITRLLEREMPSYKPWPVKDGSFPIYVKR